MKRTILIAAGLALTLVTGCVVTSVYPFYTAQDEVSDPALVGTWGDAGAANDGKEFWRIDRLGTPGYLLASVEKGQTNRYEAHLFRLKQHSFLDLRSTNRIENHLPLHYLLRIEPSPRALRFQLLNLEWLSQWLEKDPQALRHLRVPAEPGNTNNCELVLTANTAELQEFILKHINDTNAFTDPTEMKRWQ